MNSKMSSSEMYYETKVRLAEIKTALESRHYIQCNSFCERLLLRDHSQIHPVHLAYIHFYLALSHDATARDARLCRRSEEINIAEKNYLAALKALSPASPFSLISTAVPEDHSSNASTSDTEELYSSSSTSSNHWRRPSDASQRSRASSATSISTSEDYTPYTSTHTYSSSRKSRPRPINPPNSASLYKQEQFSAHLSAFRGMIRSHLQSLRELKQVSIEAETQSSSRFFKRVGSNASGSSEEDMERLGEVRRMERSSVVFRKRFDPERTRELCEEVLSELRM